MFVLLGLSEITREFFINNTSVMVSQVELVAVAVRAKIFTVGASDLNSCNSEYVSRKAAILLLFEVPLKSK